MRIDSTNFSAKNKQLSKEPRFVLQIASDTAATDLTYFKSHADAATPSGAVVSSARLISAPTASQTLNPLLANSSVGKISARIQDTDGALTTFIRAKLDDLEGLRDKRVKLFLGYRGLAWTDYTEFQTQTIVDYDYKDGEYVINCRDIQYSLKEDIFNVKTTTLTDTITETDTTITVDDTSAFEMVAHGSAWAHLPSTTVGYIKIDKEVISYTGKTATTFTGCTRGVLNTRPARHETDNTLAVARRKKVEEYIYIDLPVIKTIYALMTGSIYGTINTLPDHWHLGISTAYIATSKFTGIGLDIWDTSDDTAGLLCEFKGLKKTKGKKFIEQELLRLASCFMPVLNDGQLGLRRMTNVTFDAPAVRLLNSSNIVSYGTLKHDADQLYNHFRVLWNYDTELEDFTREKVLADTSLHALTTPITLKMRGLDGNKHTDKTLEAIFSFLKDSYASYPKLLTVECLFSQNDIEVGDIVRVQLDEVHDASRGTVYLDSSFRVHQISLNPEAGTVSLSLFGSSEKATATSPTTGDALDSGFFTDAGLPAANLLTTALSTTLTGGVLHLDTNGTLTGQTSIPGSSNTAVYHYNGDIQIDDGVIIDITENVVLLINGFVQVNGTIRGKGTGATGAAYLGTTVSGGGIHMMSYSGSGAVALVSEEGTTTEGTVDAAPVFHFQYDGGTPFASLLGAPTDLRGTGGSTGGDVTFSGGLTGQSGTVLASGGAGGQGGAGLWVISKGFDVGGSGGIDLSGNDGTAGGTGSVGSLVCKAGTGAGGRPGVFLITLAGSTYSETDALPAFTANTGDSAPTGDILPSARHYTYSKKAERWYSYYTGWRAESNSEAAFRVQYLPASETAALDAPTTADKGTLSLVELTNTPESVSNNWGSIEVSVSDPADSTYSHTNIYAKLSTEPDTAYKLEGIATGTMEAVIVRPMDGLTYDIKAVPVSVYGVESTDFDVDQITMSNTTGGATMATGNYIGIGQTAFDTGAGAWIEKTASGVKASFGNSAGDKLVINNDAGSIVTIVGDVTASSGAIGGWTIGATDLTSGSGANTVGLDSGGSNPAIYCGSATPGSAPFRVTQAGALTASNATVTGTITTSALTADGGTIGGWDLSSTTIESTNNRVILDSSNQRIQVQNAGGTSYVRLDANGVTGVDSVLGTVFTLPTDGSAPTFASGVINSTIYNISTSGILRTASTVGDGSAASAGVLINDTGIKGFPANSSTPNFTLSTTDGGITSIKGSIGGWTIGSTTLANGTNMVIDSSNMYIGIKSSTFGAPGIQLQYNSGTPRFYVGNGGYKSVQFDGTDVILGRDSKLLGADAYNNDNIYISGFLPWFFYQDNSTGGGSFGTSADGIVASVASAGSAWGQWLRNVGDSFTSFTWDNDRRVKYKVYTPASTANQAVIGTGARNASYTEFLGFVFETDGYIYSRSAGGSSNTDTSLQTWSTSTYYEIEVVFDPNAAEAYFYVDGTLKATHSANLPSGTSSASVWTTILMTWTSGSSAVKVQELKFEQQ